MFKGFYQTILMISLISLFMGCTQKDNLTGTEGQIGPEPVETVISTDLFTDFYSFEDSVKTYNSDNLLMGNYESNGFPNQAVTLIKFTSLVDTFYQVENAKIRLQIKEKYNFDVIDNSTVKIGKVKTEWFESTATWNEPTDSTSWQGANAFSIDPDIDLEFIPDLTMTADEDSLVIDLPVDILQQWILADTLNYGVAFLAEGTDNRFIDFYSSEYGDDFSPRIYFDYAETEEDTLITYWRSATNDVHLKATDYQYNIFQDQLIISDIQPIRMLVKFDLPVDIFTASVSQTIQDTTDFLAALSINQANLILTADCPDPYPSELNRSLNIDPFIMISDTLNLDDPSKPLIDEDDYEDLFITSSNDSLDSAEFKVDITSIIQNIVSGEYENYGIMLKSIYENKDFKHTEFDRTQTYISIIFTPPFLED